MNRSLTVVVDDPPMRTLNARGHWTARSGHAANLREHAAWLAKPRWAGRDPLDYATIDVTLHPADRKRRDPDNLAPLAKPVIDGLVDAGVLAGDDWTHVHAVTFRIRPASGVDLTQLSVTVTEVPQP